MAMNYQDGGADSEVTKNSPLRPADQNAPNMGEFQMAGADEIPLGRNAVKPPYSNPGMGEYQMGGADEVDLGGDKAGTWPWANQASGVTKPL